MKLTKDGSFGFGVADASFDYEGHPHTGCPARDFDALGVPSQVPCYEPVFQLGYCERHSNLSGVAVSYVPIPEAFTAPTLTAVEDRNGVYATRPQPITCSANSATGHACTAPARLYGVCEQHFKLLQESKDKG